MALTVLVGIRSPICQVLPSLRYPIDRIPWILWLSKTALYTWIGASSACFPFMFEMPILVSRFQTPRCLFGDDPWMLSSIVVPIQGASNSVPGVVLVHAIFLIAYVSTLIHSTILVPARVNLEFKILLALLLPIRKRARIVWAECLSYNSFGMPTTCFATLCPNLSDSHSQGSSKCSRVSCL